jgi:DNA-binding NtrC family response regulator
VESPSKIIEPEVESPEKNVELEEESAEKIIEPDQEKSRSELDEDWEELELEEQEEAEYIQLQTTINHQRISDVLNNAKIQIETLKNKLERLGDEENIDRVKKNYLWLLLPVALVVAYKVLRR